MVLYLVGLGLGDEKVSFSVLLFLLLLRPCTSHPPLPGSGADISALCAPCQDITVRGLEKVRGCSKIFLEHYTSVLGVDKARLEAFYEKEVILADRFLCESSAEDIYACAAVDDVALLVVGDPLCATTHTDMMLRARAAGCRVEVVHNASVMGAIASCGLQL